MEVSLDDQRTLAVYYFGQQWLLSMRDPNGPRRRRRQKSLRNAAILRAITDPIIARGDNCGTCKHRVDGDCEIQSDFYGRAPVAVDHHPCQYWTVK